MASESHPQSTRSTGPETPSARARTGQGETDAARRESTDDALESTDDALKSTDTTCSTVPLVVRDVASRRESYVPASGVRFRATDTGRVYRGDGRRWLLVSSPGVDVEFEDVVVSAAAHR